MPEWLLPLAAFIFMMATPILAWWGSTRYFTGRFDEQQLHTRQWRELIEKQLEHINATLSANSYAAMLVRMQHVEEDLTRIHRWKHTVVDPYIPGAVDAMKHRLDRLDRG